ncbi:hypothetical protein L3Y34_003627 [Caenorhabditis briggsae]|uniref:Uncharacterized protein n=1 Tax=Caenorhabditis briggsae TaxID=6238 RepID=A0AAE9ABU8_CAEBR|nr:hypothetical protein L3Y34_003627 [Caenorhabditis briggsae]
MVTGSRSPGSRSRGHLDQGHPDPGHPDPGHPDPGHPDTGHRDPGHPDPGHQVIKYFTSTKTLLIIKNGFTLPVYIGQAFLVIFIVSIVMFCNGPVVQYLQVKTILKATSKQDANFGIFLIPISIGIPALALVCLGYIPKSEVFPQEIMNKMKNQGMATTLTIPMALEMANIMPLICASFIFLVMLVSIIFAISCFVRIKILMKQKFAASTSSSSKKSQDQLNTMLLIQFIFPFFTIHTPILITFFLPFFDINLEFLSDNMLYLSAWCPAANPIIVMSVVKNVREVLQDKFLPRKISVSDGKSSTQDVVLQKRSR